MKHEKKATLNDGASALSAAQKREPLTATEKGRHPDWWCIPVFIIVIGIFLFIVWLNSPTFGMGY